MTVAKLLCAVALVASISACSRPHVAVSTVNDNPHLQFTNASSTAVLILDGVTIGPASVYDGVNKTLVVKRGTHQVEVRDRNRVLFSQPVYFGGEEAKTIELPN
ncbi:MAG TPA: hypothetical protein VN766_07810 [Stellaceae bacterium]|jgi:hypothetical protein|nr:hypothetical protein [Stellaceae bacterium]